MAALLQTALVVQQKEGFCLNILPGEEPPGVAL